MDIKKARKKWHNMRARCKNRPQYADVTVAPEWQTFEGFLSWLEKNPGWEDKDLDKDLGGGHYGPDSCVLLSHTANCALRGQPAAYLHSDGGGWVASHAREYLGRYPTEVQARAVAAAHKAEHIRQLAPLEGNIVAMAGMLRYADEVEHGRA